MDMYAEKLLFSKSNACGHPNMIMGLGLCNKTCRQDNNASILNDPSLNNRLYVSGGNTVCTMILTQASKRRHYTHSGPNPFKNSNDGSC